MDKNTLFGKTAAGREALTTRPAGLGPRLRSLLIMVDGKRNLAEFERLSGSPDQAMNSLGELLSGGWIEVVGADGLPKAAFAAAVASPTPPVSGPAASLPVMAATPVAEATVTLPFSEARRQVVRFINDQLGPMGETLAIRAESCKSPVDLQAALPRIREGLKSFKGMGVVQQFDEALAERLPKV